MGDADALECDIGTLKVILMLCSAMRIRLWVLMLWSAMKMLLRMMTISLRKITSLTSQGQDYPVLGDVALLLRVVKTLSRVMTIFAMESDDDGLEGIHRVINLQS